MWWPQMRVCGCGEIFIKTSGTQHNRCVDCQDAKAREYGLRHRVKYQHMGRACPKTSAKAREKRERLVSGEATESECFGNMLARTRANSKEGSWDHELTLDKIQEMWIASGGKCAITGTQMTMFPGKINSASIDRIDSESGYTLANSHMVCRWVNMAKLSFPIGEIEAILSEFQNMDSMRPDLLSDRKSKVQDVISGKFSKESREMTRLSKEMMPKARVPEITQEERERRSKSLKGMARSPEHCAAISAAKKGFKMSDEQKSKISATLRLRTPEQNRRSAESRIGLKRTEETKQKMSVSNKKAWEKRKQSTCDAQRQG